MSIRAMSMTLNTAIIECARQQRAADQAIIDRMIVECPAYQKALRLHARNVRMLNFKLLELGRRIGGTKNADA